MTWDGDNGTRLAVYELNCFGEAEYVRWFCSTNCRDAFILEHANTPIKRALDTDAIEGTVCDKCNADLGITQDVERRREEHKRWSRMSCLDR